MTTFATDHIRPDERFDYWREVITDRFLPLRPERCGELPFEGSLRSSNLAGLPLTAISVQGQSVSQPGSSAPDEGYFFLNLQAAGAMRFEQAGARYSNAGSAFLIDSSSPFHLDCPTRMTHICVTMPKDQLRDRLLRNRQLGGEQLSRDRAADAACLDYLALLSDLDRLPDDDSESTARYLLDLLAYALDRRVTTPSVPKRAVQAVTYARARKLIESEIGRAELSPAWLAARLGLSLRTLQRVFHRYGGTPGSMIVQKRIESAGARLADPGRRSESITEIALACGFSDLSYFCRSFHHSTGYSPSEFRRRMT